MSTELVDRIDLDPEVVTVPAVCLTLSGSVTLFVDSVDVAKRSSTAISSNPSGINTNYNKLTYPTAS